MPFCGDTGKTQLICSGLGETQHQAVLLGDAALSDTIF